VRAVGRIRKAGFIFSGIWRNVGFEACG